MLPMPPFHLYHYLEENTITTLRHILDGQLWCCSRKDNSTKQSFVMNIVVLLTPSCAQLEEQYPPCSSFDCIVRDMQRLLEELRQCFFLSSRNELEEWKIRNNIVFQRDGRLCVQVLSEIEHIDEKSWHLFSKQTSKKLEQSITELYIPYLQEGMDTKHTHVVDVYNLVALTLFVEEDYYHYRHVLLITSTPSILCNNRREQEVVKLLVQKNISLSMFQISSSFGEKVSSFIQWLCSFTNGVVFTSQNISLVERLVNCCLSSVEYSNEDNNACCYPSFPIACLPTSCSYEEFVKQGSQTWNCSPQVFVWLLSWHISQGFKLDWRHAVDENRKMLNRDDSSTFIFGLLLDSKQAICWKVTIKGESCFPITSKQCLQEVASCLEKENFGVQSELVYYRKRKHFDMNIEQSVSTSQWKEWLSCEEFIFRLFSLTSQSSLQAVMKELPRQNRVIPFVAFYIFDKCLQRKQHSNDLPLIEKVESLVLQFCPNSVQRDHRILCMIDSQKYLMFHIVPVAWNNIRLMVSSFGMCCHEFHFHLNNLMKHFESIDEYILWSFMSQESYQSSCFIENELEMSEPLNFMIAHANDLCHLIWDEEECFLHLPNNTAALKIQKEIEQLFLQIGYVYLIGDSYMEEKQDYSACVRYSMLGKCPVLVLIEKKRNQVSIRYNKAAKLLKESSNGAMFPNKEGMTSLASWVAADIYLEWWRQLTQRVRQPISWHVDESLWKNISVIFRETCSGWFTLEERNDNSSGPTCFLLPFLEKLHWQLIDCPSSKRHVITDHSFVVHPIFLTWIKKSNVDNVLLGIAVGNISESNQPNALSFYGFILQKECSGISLQKLSFHLYFQQTMQHLKTLALHMILQKGQQCNRQWICQVTKQWNCHRFSLRNIIQQSEEYSNNESFQLYDKDRVLEIRKRFVVILQSIGYRRATLDEDDQIEWLSFSLKRNTGNVLSCILLKLEIFSAEDLVIQLYDCSDSSWDNRQFQCWLEFHKLLLTIFGKWLALMLHGCCLVPGWLPFPLVIQLWKQGFTSYVPIESTFQAVDWKERMQDDIFLVDCKLMDGHQVRFEACQVNFRQIEWNIFTSHEDYLWDLFSNISFSHLFWAVIHTGYLQVEHLLNYSMETFMMEETEQSVHVSNFFSKRLENSLWTQCGIIYVQSLQILDQMDSITDWEWITNELQRTCRYNGCCKWITYQDAETRPFIGFIQGSKLASIHMDVTQSLLANHIQEKTSHEHSWLVFMLRLVKTSASHGYTIQGTFYWIPLYRVANIVFQKKHQLVYDIIELVEESQKTTSFLNGWMTSWIASCFHRFRQSMRWKAEIQASKLATSWSIFRFLESFPHYSFSQLLSRQAFFKDFCSEDKLQLPNQDQLEWDKVFEQLQSNTNNDFVLIKKASVQNVHWYLIMPSQFEHVVLLLTISTRRNASFMKIIMQSHEMSHVAFQAGNAFLKWLVWQTWNQCLDNWYILRRRLD